MAVLGIFVFILWQILPLFQSAKVKELNAVTLPKGEYQKIGIDEWGELPFVLSKDAKLLFADIRGKKDVTIADLKFPEQKEITSYQYYAPRQDIVFGTADGHFSVVQINYHTAYEGNQRVVKPEIKAEPFRQIGRPDFPIRQIDYGDSGTDKMVAAIQEVNGKNEVHVVTLGQTRTLFGTGETTVGQSLNLTEQVKGNPERLVVNSQASDLVVSTASGEVYYFSRAGDEMKLRQVFAPFADLNDKKLGSINFLLGGVSLVVTGSEGVNRIYSLYLQEGGDYRTFGRTKEFERLPAPATFYDASQRNKAFLLGTGAFASLRYGTTEDIRWQTDLPFQIQDGILGGKYDKIILLGKDQKLHIFQLEDHHPESSLKALFGKIWYEGASEPKFDWQSTGATDDFESKLSLVPLIIGTLKGTFYAMIFAVPIALLAALYTSQFLHPSLRIYVKPTMEIMASLPSVVLGFLAALWLAPILETKVPSILVVIILVPAVALLFGWFWSLFPITIRRMIGAGYEWIFFLPLLVTTLYVAWNLGPILEKMFFVVKDPQTGALIADFRLWWPSVTGLPFEQRNSLVVGFMMGFAVIPIIFTIAEDSLSNVPAALTSGSLALGASRWQTALRIVLPTASAGIFSAIMIGLGRAVGETMIVVMATGNTPIMDFNIFSGMRTLSANIAVELPEAPVHSTLYRMLFLGGMALFLLTFFANTLAELLRQHLREKYKTV